MGGFRSGFHYKFNLRSISFRARTTMEIFVEQMTLLRHLVILWGITVVMIIWSCSFCRGRVAAPLARPIVRLFEYRTYMRGRMGIDSWGLMGITRAILPLERPCPPPSPAPVSPPSRISSSLPIVSLNPRDPRVRLVYPARRRE